MIIRQSSFRFFASSTISFLVLFQIASASKDKLLEYSVEEDVPVGHFIGDVKLDSLGMLQLTSSDDLNRLRFHFRRPNKHLFIDDKTGVIQTSQHIDREELCPYLDRCDLVFDVSIKSVPIQFLHVLKVVLHILDINDNQPVFPQEQVTIQIPENTPIGAQFLVPAAEDADTGQFSVQEYRTLRSDPEEFELVVAEQIDGSKDIRLKLVGRLDRESVDEYSITVLAIDGGEPPRTGTLIVDVIVLDSNDNSPQFDNSTYEVDIDENLPPLTTIIHVHASDPDQGLNSKIVYSFAEYTERAYGGVFGVDPVTGAIFVRGPVDYEHTQAFVLSIRAADMGTGSLPVFTKVFVDVRDLNDNAPRITVNVLKNSDFAQVEENADPGAFVAHVAVKDRDSGRNGETECAIDSLELFATELLFDNEYKITTAVSFDREVQPNLELILTCRDRGSPVLVSTKLIDVVILDVNDNDPIFSDTEYRIELFENNNPNTPLIKINATDLDVDRNAALVYKLHSMPGTPPDVLSIDPIHGVVTALVVFDYEQRTEYSFLVTVSDRGIEPRSASAGLSLKIFDRNDELPVFDKPVYHFDVQENQPIGVDVGNVTATDLDSSPRFRQVTYSIADHHNVFQVDPLTGNIRTLKRLDREETPVHKFFVVTSNRGFQGVESRAEVIVEVGDDNDNTPKFVFPGISRRAPVEAASSERGGDQSDEIQKESEGFADHGVEIGAYYGIGRLVARLIATDPDSGKNGELEYFIYGGNVDALFRIDPKTGVITTARDPLLDPSENKQHEWHRLVVGVQDQGSPRLMSLADLTILVNASLGHGRHAASLSNFSIFEGPNLFIFIGVAIAFVLVVLLLVTSVVCLHLHRRHRLRDEPRDKPRDFVPSDGFVQQTRPSDACPCRSPSCVTRTSVNTYSAAAAAGANVAASAVDTEDDCCRNSTHTFDAVSVLSQPSHRDACRCLDDESDEEEDTSIRDERMFEDSWLQPISNRDRHDATLVSSV